MNTEKLREEIEFIAGKSESEALEYLRWSGALKHYGAKVTKGLVLSRLNDRLAELEAVQA